MMGADVIVTPIMDAFPALTMIAEGELSTADVAEHIAVGACATPGGPALFIGVRTADGRFAGGAVPLKLAKQFHRSAAAAIARIEAGDYNTLPRAG